MFIILEIIPRSKEKKKRRPVNVVNLTNPIKMIKQKIYYDKRLNNAKNKKGFYSKHKQVNILPSIH